MFRNIFICLVILVIVRASVGQYAVYNKRIWDDYYRNAKSWEIGSIMDASADPCQNYYQFACGNWSTHYPATKHQRITGGLRNAISEFYDTISNMLNSTNSEDTASERMIKNFYKSCIHVPVTTKTENRRQMKKLIREFGKMPALEDNKWQHKHFDCLKTVGNISNKYGIDILFQFFSFTAKDKKSNTLHLKPLEQQLENTSGPVVEKYKTTVEKNLIKFLGIKKSIAKRTAAKIATFEVTLARAAEKTTDSIMKLNMDEISIRDLNLLKLAHITFGYLPTGQIFLHNPTYFVELANILKKTPKETVANYIFYHLLRQFATDFHQDRNSDLCMQQTISFFPRIVSKMNHRINHLDETLSKYLHLWQEIKTSLHNVLESDRLSWYDDANREFALEKLHSMKLFVDTYTDYDLDEDYSSLALNASDYINNIKLIKSFDVQKAMAALDMQPDLFEGVVDLSTPLYQPLLNTVVLPVSTLLSNYLMISSVPKALGYSRMGFFLGHEITHGFSGNARLYDRLGDYAGAIGDIEREYEERTKCIYDQYKNYEATKTSRPQQESQDENIADIAGIALAYQAYMRWLKDDSRTRDELNMETLPYLKYTNKQLFFIYYSQTWCADYTAEYAKYEEDGHTIDPIRAVLPLVNFDAFAKAFNCPVGSQMNPRKKCTLY